MTDILRTFTRISLLAPILLLSASPTFSILAVPRSIGDTGIEKNVLEILPEMSTGIEQELVLDGVSAQSLNAQIPISFGAGMALPTYAPITKNEVSYTAARLCLTQAIYYEAANEALRGKQAVAQVVLNRMRHAAYPNSVCGVVYQGANAQVCQFSFTCDGALSRAPLKRQWAESKRVAEEALAGKQLAIVGTATHYHADYVVPKWAYTLQKMEVIGTHIFYRFPGRGGRPDAFKSRWSQSESIPFLRNRNNRPNSDLDTELAANLDEISEFEEGVNVEQPLPVPSDPTDRHATNDVGGRLNPAKEFRLNIPDPVEASRGYAATVANQAKSDADATIGDNPLGAVRQGS